MAGNPSQVFDPDSVGVFFVIPGFDGGNHVFGQRGESIARGNADGTLMDIEEKANPVTGAMVVIFAAFPERLAGDGIKRQAGGAVGETSGSQRNMRFEHDGEIANHFRGRAAESYGSGDVGGSVEVLGAAVEEQQRT